VTVPTGDSNHDASHLATGSGCTNFETGLALSQNLTRRLSLAFTMTV